MNARQKKIVEWGIALVIIVLFITQILPDFMSRMKTTATPFYELLKLTISIIVFALLHYFILQKTLNQQFPFQHLRRHRQINPNSLRGPFSAYMTMFSLTSTILFSILLVNHYFNLKELTRLLRVNGIFVLLLALITTTMLLIFSEFFFAKPVRETWKAVLLAGLIAGAVGFATAFALQKFISLRQASEMSVSEK